MKKVKKTKRQNNNKGNFQSLNDETKQIFRQSPYQAVFGAEINTKEKKKPFAVHENKNKLEKEKKTKNTERRRNNRNK